MTLKDADKIKEAIKKIAPVLARSDDIIKVIDSVPEVVIDTDTISRKAAIEAVEFGITHAKAINKETGEVTALFEESNAELQEAADRIKKLPSALPESDSGRWERHYSRPGVYADLYWHCSKCGYKTDYQYANVNHHYCPHCGRKMEREVSNE